MTVELVVLLLGTQLLNQSLKLPAWWWLFKGVEAVSNDEINLYSAAVLRDCRSNWCHVLAFDLDRVCKMLAKTGLIDAIRDHIFNWSNCVGE